MDIQLISRATVTQITSCLIFDFFSQCGKRSKLANLDRKNSYILGFKRFAKRLKSGNIFLLFFFNSLYLHKIIEYKIK